MGFGYLRFCSLTPPVTSTAMQKSVCPVKRSNGSGLTKAPSIKVCPSSWTGVSSAGRAALAAIAGSSGPLALTYSVWVKRSAATDAERNFEGFEGLRQIRRQHQLENPLRLEQRGRAGPPIIPDPALPAEVKMADERAAPGEGGLAIKPDFAGGHSRGIGGPDQRADAGARDHGRLDAKLVEGLQNGDMREPARPAAAKRQPDPHRVHPHAEARKDPLTPAFSPRRRAGDSNCPLGERRASSRPHPLAGAAARMQLATSPLRERDRVRGSFAPALSNLAISSYRQLRHGAASRFSERQPMSRRQKPPGQSIASTAR